MDRRTSLQWMLAAASLPALGGAEAAPVVHPGDAARRGKTADGAKGYGTDPDLVPSYRPGQLWPLSFSPDQRALATALCALIIPADEHSPGAAEVGVPVFIDEWISAPYPTQSKDRQTVLAGLAWLDAESQRRFDRPFAKAAEAQQRQICDDICWLPRAQPAFTEAATFFARFRDLTAGGFYTTPQGSKDLGFAGNLPSQNFDGPPPAALKIVGVD